jgi:carbamoyl-phosphate synthase large subunit
MTRAEEPFAANRDRGHPAVNVLVTSAGRRTSLVRAFTEEAHKRGGRVHAGDVDALAPALYLADAVLRTRRTEDPAYVGELLRAVALNAIGLVVPTIDKDLSILAANRARFETLGCRVAVSNSSLVEITLDKYQTGTTFGALGVRVPRSWLPPIERPDELPARVFVKPRRGSASQSAHEVAREALESVLRIVPDPVVQELLTGPEITVDALLDFDGRPIHFVPRLRIRTMGGESVQGVTLQHDPVVEDWIERVLRHCSELGARGPITIQGFLSDDGPILSEINPRFAGGVPLAIAAGGRYPGWLLDMAEGRPVEPRLRQFEPGLFMTRYNTEHFMRQPMW